MTEPVSALPDIEQLMSTFMRAQPEIEELAADRVYTTIPSNPEWPLLLVRRVAGQPRLSRPRRVDSPVVQFDAYGGTKKQAHDLAEAACAVTAARVCGVHDIGVIGGVTFGQFSWLPDPAYSPARARYVATLTLTSRPRDTGDLA